MRARRPSETALFVAFVRALVASGLSQVQGFADPVSARLLPRFWAALLPRSVRWLQAMTPEQRARALAYLELLPLRIRAIDVELERAVAAGCAQVVMLGAGFDVRAHLLTALQRAHVFEVDHPATQKLKRAHAAGVPVLACELTYVAVDFERDSLAGALRAAGHRPEQLSAWVWEGVVMYLSDAGLRASLRDIASASAPGSVLIVNYHEPGKNERRWSPRRLVFALLGEPQIGVRTRERMRAEVEAHGFELVHDSGTADWIERFAPGLPVVGPGEVARVLVAVRTERASAV